jgi:thiamine biosynthesis lipoprotein
MRDTFGAMGCEIVVAGATPDELDAVKRLFADRDRTFSRFAKDSELSRVNRSGGRLVVVSEQFAEMVRLALDAARATGGAVDPTVGAAIVALGYDREFDELPPDGPPAGAVPAGRYREVRVHGRVLERPPGVQLDLNGVVKSRTVDDALALLGGAGYVSAGGDLATRSPLDVGLPGGGAIRLERGALATSGTLTRSWRRGGQRFHHLVDPATGSSASSQWTCVTVAGVTCLAADLAAKTAFLLGERGPAWLDTRSLPGRLVRHDGSVVETAAWAREATPRAA